MWTGHFFGFSLKNFGFFLKKQKKTSLKEQVCL